MELNPNRRFSARLMLIVVGALLQIGFSGTAFAQGNAGMELTLPQAIDLALKQNRNLKLAQLAVVDNEQKKKAARADYFPRISNESTAFHVNEVQQLVIPEGALGVDPTGGPIPAKTAVIGQGTFTAYTSGTGLSQPLTKMFRTQQANRAATADINTAKIQVDQAEDDIALKVRQLYYGILIAQSKQKAAQEEADAAEVESQESTSSVEQGSAMEVVALDSHAALLGAKQTVLTQNLQIRDLTLELNDLLGLPLHTQLHLRDDPSVASASIPARDDCLRTARQQSPEIREALQAVEKERAGLAAAKDAYIPDVSGFARYSYQSGIPFLVHNFGTFGVIFEYELFDGGRRNAEIGESRTMLSKAELNLANVEEEVTVQVETAYDKVEQMQSLVTAAEESLKAQTEATRVAERQVEQGEALASARAEAAAKTSSAKVSLLEATLGLSLAQAELKRVMGELP
jgi:outer membrane protein TolC